MVVGLRHPPSRPRILPLRGAACPGETRRPVEESGQGTRLGESTTLLESLCLYLMF